VLRLATPLAYNFVLLLDVDATALSRFIGVVGVVPFFGGSFTRVFPLFMLLMAILTVTDTWERIGRMLGITNSRVLITGRNADIAEGRRLLLLTHGDIV